MAGIGTQLDDANNNVFTIATLPVTLNGVTVIMEIVGILDPVSGLAVSVQPPGTRGANALVIQGDPLGVPVPVALQSNGAMTSAITGVLVDITGPTTLLNANPARLGVIIYNEGQSNVYIAYGANVTINGGYSFQIAPGEVQYIDTLPYRGPLTAIVGPGASPCQMQVTELTP